MNRGSLEQRRRGAEEQRSRGAEEQRSRYQFTSTEDLAARLIGLEERHTCVRVCLCV
jgi:hypothetical protein